LPGAPVFREPKNWKISDNQAQKTNSKSKDESKTAFKSLFLIWFWGLIMPFTRSIPMGILISKQIVLGGGPKLFYATLHLHGTETSGPSRPLYEACEHYF